MLTTGTTIAHDWTVLPLNCVVNKEDLSKGGKDQQPRGNRDQPSQPLARQNASPTLKHATN